MPPMAAALGSPENVRNVANYVLSLSGSPHNAIAAQLGKEKFVACAACHGPDGKGNQALGAPNLTDKIWLYGGDRTSIAETITNSRYGIMPAWGQRLDPVTVKMLAAYVHSLGGGEKFIAEAPASDAQVKAEAGAVPAPMKANASR
jgi:cytochrome c oxidase cbb3-type subunit 3